MSNQDDCGLCLSSHVCLRQVLSALWVLTVPLKWVECLVVGPVWYLSLMADHDVYLLVASFLVGAIVGQALSTLAWMGGNLLVAKLTASRLMPLLRISKACGHSIDTRDCRILYAMGEPGYFGATAGLCLFLAKVSFEEDSGDWCRTSEAWPAEAVYIPVFFVACLSGVVLLPPLRGNTETEHIAWRPEPLR